MKEGFKFSDYINAGDINGFLAIIVNILAVISFVSTLLIFQFKIPSDIVIRQIVPAMSFAVFISNSVFSLLAFKLAKSTGRKDITALPSGLDTPSSLGLTIFVIGPAYTAITSKGVTPEAAGMIAWHIGMGAVFYIGIIKVILSPAAYYIKKYVPMAGIMGSLAGLAIGLIGIQPLIETFSIPIVGLVSFGIILYTLVAKIKLPWNIPGVLAAVVSGTIIYHIFCPYNFLGVQCFSPSYALHLGYSFPFAGIIEGIKGAFAYLPIIIPFAIVVFLADTANTAAADIIGDHYNERTICLSDGLCTIAGSLFGSIGQTTIYIQQIPSRTMDSKIGYTILIAIFCLLGTFMGFITFFITFIPAAALAPILVYIAIEMISYVFVCVPTKHYAAVSFAMLPPILKYISMQFSDISAISEAKLHSLVSNIGSVIPHVLVSFSISNGYMLVSLLWGGLLVEIIEKGFKGAAIYLFILSFLSFFGVIHSGDTSGSIYIPWLAEKIQRTISYDFSSSYLVLSIVLCLIALYQSKKKQVEA